MELHCFFHITSQVHPGILVLVLADIAWSGSGSFSFPISTCSSPSSVRSAAATAMQPQKNHNYGEDLSIEIKTRFFYIGLHVQKTAFRLQE